MFLILFLLFFCFTQQAQCLDKYISLTKVDSSYAMSGFQFRAYDNIIVENKENPNGLIFAISLLTGDVENKPQATITDDKGTKSAIDVIQYFGARLTLSLGPDRNPNFVIMFVRSDETNRNAPYAFNSALTVVPVNGKAPYRLNSDTLPLMFTFISQDFNAFPVIDCQVTEIMTDLCTVDMFLGGQPSDEGKEKYRLISFTNETISKYRTSYVYGSAVTFFVPAGCNASYECRGREAITETEPDENSMGFFVSGEYPGVFDTEYRSLMDGWIKTNTWTFDSNVTLSLLSYDVGSNGSLGIVVGTGLTNFTGTSNTSVTYSNVGNQLVVAWEPSDDVRNGFMARWSTYLENVPNTTTSTTTTTTTTTSTTQETTTKSFIAINFLKSLIAMLLYVIMIT